MPAMAAPRRKQQKTPSPARLWPHQLSPEWNGAKLYFSCPIVTTRTAQLWACSLWLLQ